MHRAALIIEINSFFCMGRNAERIVKTLLQSVGVAVNGSAPWDIRVHDARFFPRVLGFGSLGLGESYMDGWWDCERIDMLIDRVLRGDLEKQFRRNWPAITQALLSRFFNFQTIARAFANGQAHYDIGNDLYSAMLDARMIYTCGYWKTATTLDEAQEAKFDLVCRKIGLKPKDRVLDIGCGWGSFAVFAAERYGASVVGITISEAQAALARQRASGLPVEILLQDYREFSGEPFDHVVSLGMFEHVGYKNYRAYMQTVQRHLKDDGLFLLHTIGGNVSDSIIDPWIGTYIFPHAMLPSVAQIGRAAEGIFVMEDWHNFGTDYDKTLVAWHDNVERHWQSLSSRYSERFRRMWRYYLLMCAGTFRARKNQLWQVVLSKRGVSGGYVSPR
jgi:cyclopropane-fatty-acyl-phospholipid synthase